MNIKLLIMDVDGTRTDGRIYMGSNGEVAKAFDVKDGYRIVKLPGQGIQTMILTGRESEIVAMRAKELNVTYVYQGIIDKLGKLQEVAAECKLLPDEMAYIGDDLNDMDCMKYCGLSGAPADAIDDVKKIADYVCRNEAGHGAVREFADWILKR